MSNITAFEFATTAARAAMEGRKSDKGARPQAVRAFLEATTNVEREQATAEWGAGFIRRGLFEQAKFFKADEEVANAFRVLRESINLDGSVDEDDNEVDEVVEHDLIAA